MAAREIKPPYIPMLDNKEDLKHFDQEILNIPIESPPQMGSGESASQRDNEDDNDDFRDFSFKASSFGSNEFGRMASGEVL
jgi:hypothetical protein